MRLPALPFAVHVSRRAEFGHRWARARSALLVAFVVAPLIVLGMTLAALIGASGKGPAGTGTSVVALALVVPSAGYLLWFRASGRFLTRTRYWTVRAFSFGLVQLLGTIPLAVVAGGAVGVLCPVVIALGVLASTVAAARAHRALFAAADGAPAATSLPLERDLRIHPPRLYGTATIGADRLSWSLKPRGRYGFPGALVAGTVPFGEITGVRVDQVDEHTAPLVGPGVAAPAGPVVVVSTRRGDAVVAAKDAAEFAVLLDLRLRLAAEPGWS
ncbi:hypothetical protein FCN18_04865 [Prauserella endophytica]|uniref:Bacterial Pleckstrin homology domain-containing protein n=2 Tax=Prauserella endophytica TaxID=1592324 RepID=A0ABY2SAP1_9PSEU|nr:hypothetical protein FCN18_04865 [Prauserella endophytica]